MMFEQLAELSLVKFNLLCKTLLHHMTPNNNTHLIGIINVHHLWYLIPRKLFAKDLN